MGIIKVLLVMVEIISGVLLVGVILLQKSKDEGLGLAFGAGVGETLFGSRAGNVLTKITIGLGIVFMANTLLLGYVLGSGSGTGSLTDDLPDTPVPVRSAAPAGGMPLPAVPAQGQAPAGAMGSTPVPATPAAPAPAAIPVSIPSTAPAKP